MRKRRRAKRSVKTETVTFTRAQDVQVGDTLKRQDKDVEVTSKSEVTAFGGGAPPSVRLVLDNGDEHVLRPYFRLPVVETEEA